MTALLEKRADAIARKLTMAREDLAAIRRKADVLGMQGGPHPLFFRGEFHRTRVELLEWMTSASAEAINAKRLELEQQLGLAVRLKYGSMQDVPAHVVAQIAHVELLELGLGLHPCQRRG